MQADLEGELDEGSILSRDAEIAEIHLGSSDAGAAGRRFELIKHQWKGWRRLARTCVASLFKAVCVPECLQALLSTRPIESSKDAKIAQFDQRSAIRFGKRIAGGLPIPTIRRRPNLSWLDLVHEGPKWLRSNGESPPSVFRSV